MSEVAIDPSGMLTGTDFFEPRFPNPTANENFRGIDYRIYSSVEYDDAKHTCALRCGERTTPLTLLPAEDGKKLTARPCHTFPQEPAHAPSQALRARTRRPRHLLPSRPRQHQRNEEQLPRVRRQEGLAQAAGGMKDASPRTRMARCSRPRPATCASSPRRRTSTRGCKARSTPTSSRCRCATESMTLIYTTPRRSTPDETPRQSPATTNFSPQIFRIWPV